MTNKFLGNRVRTHNEIKTAKTYSSCRCIARIISSSSSLLLLTWSIALDQINSLKKASTRHIYPKGGGVALLVYFTRYRLLYNQRAIGPLRWFNGRYWSRSVTGDGKEMGQKNRAIMMIGMIIHAKKKLFFVFQQPTVNLLSLLREKRDGKFWFMASERRLHRSFEFAAGAENYDGRRCLV